MKRALWVFCTIALTAIYSSQSQAELQNRGRDSLGNQLIYDTDLGITWYDGLLASQTWWYQNAWAAGMTVSFNGTNYDDWRLTKPSHGDARGELWHLYHTELGNGEWTTNRGAFENIVPTSGNANIWTQPTPDGMDWWFRSDHGEYVVTNVPDFWHYAVVVRDGDVAAVPEPELYAMFLVGLGLVGGIARRRRQQQASA